MVLYYNLRWLFSDSDLGSVISLSSSEDEQEYVVVPLPPCFNIPAFPNLEEKFLPPAPLSLRSGKRYRTFLKQ